MSNDTDDDVDAALQQWGAEQRATVTDNPAPPIADLLAERRRQHNIGAVAATVVLVTALAVALGFGLQRHIATINPRQHVTHGGPATSTGPTPTSPDPTGCARNLENAGSRINTASGQGVVQLRYTGTITCRVFETPQVALVDHSGRVTGPDAAPATLNRQLTVRPGDTLQFGVEIFFGCPSFASGKYSLRIYPRPVARPTGATGVRVPVGSLHTTESERTTGCPTLSPTQARAGRSTVLSTRTLTSLTRIAHKEAVADGDSSATADAVRSTYSRVEGTILGTPVSRSSGNPVWVIQLRGSFVCGSCGRPAGASAPRGHTVVLVLQEPGLRYSDSSVDDRRYDLSKLGTVVTLIP